LLVPLAESVRHLHACERIGHPHAHARQALELLGEPRQLRRTAGDEHLRDRERTRLALVELKRRDELSRERVQLACHGRSRTRHLRTLALGHVGTEIDLDL
jgi:hypothetical protein